MKQVVKCGWCGEQLGYVHGYQVTIVGKGGYVLGEYSSDDYIDAEELLDELRHDLKVFNCKFKEVGRDAG